MSKEVIVTDPKTGGKKGSKPERFDLIPVEPLEELARVYGFGATKYDDDNWKKGYSWKLSFAAMMRHAWSFWRGETYDKESGLHHLSHVAWHCMTLMWFTKYHKEGDCRAKETSENLPEEAQQTKPLPQPPQIVATERCNNPYCSCRKATLSEPVSL